MLLHGLCLKTIALLVAVSPQLYVSSWQPPEPPIEFRSGERIWAPGGSVREDRLLDCGGTRIQLRVEYESREGAWPHPVIRILQIDGRRIAPERLQGINALLVDYRETTLFVPECARRGSGLRLRLVRHGSAEDSAYVTLRD